VICLPWKGAPSGRSSGSKYNSALGAAVKPETGRVLVESARRMPQSKEDQIQRLKQFPGRQIPHQRQVRFEEVIFE
jgi:hypothetical protein